MNSLKHVVSSTCNVASYSGNIKQGLGKSDTQLGSLSEENYVF